MTLFVLYENPRDFPGKFVIRKQVGEVMAEKPILVTPSLVDALAILPKSAILIGRHQGDDPAIKDVWIEKETV